MLKDLTLKYYNMDYNCAESIVHAGNEYYNLGLSDHDMRMTAAFGAGMQVGDLCGALTGAACLISAKYVEERAHQNKKGLHDCMLLCVKKFQEKLGGRLCSEIKAKHFTPEIRCTNTVLLASEVIEEVINEIEEKCLY